jgi:hypothetical protein
MRRTRGKWYVIYKRCAMEKEFVLGENNDNPKGLMKKFINPKKEPLTIDRLRKFKGCEHLTDAEAEKALLGIKTLSALLIELLKEENNNSEKLNQAA